MYPVDMLKVKLSHPPCSTFALILHRQDYKSSSLPKVAFTPALQMPSSRYDEWKALVGCGEGSRA